MHRELANDRLAGAGGRADQDAVAALQRLARRLLEVVQVERLRRAEVVQGREAGGGVSPPASLHVPLGGTGHGSRLGEHARRRLWVSLPGCAPPFSSTSTEPSSRSRTRSSGWSRPPRPVATP